MNWILQAIGASVLWGLQYAIMGARLKSVSPTLALAFYFVLGAIAFCAIHFTTGREWRLPDGAMGPMVLMVILAIGANILVLQSIQGKSASQASIIETSYPVFVIIFSALLFREQPLSPKLFLAAALMLAGGALAATT